MSDIVARLRTDYCSCSDGYTSRRLVDPHCESCQTKDWRDEAADEIERLQTVCNDQDAQANRNAAEIRRLRGLLREAREYIVPANGVDEGCPDGECPECDMLRLGLRIDAALGRDAT